MNLRTFSKNLSRTGIAAIAAAFAGVVVTLYAAVHIVERIWAHATLALVQIPGLGAVVVLAAGVALLLAGAALVRRGGRRADADLGS
ncbi:hypothetical protein ABZ883_11565 [Streptomyces sp. NPDC046977]|uniref:hypothetical protein n=1 Tax=Streptomyces sp. NPDC046977 TaxID=3154703 RepID=UPI0033CA4B0D